MPTPQQKDYYRALGVPKKASTDEIRKSYRRLARKYHPDLNPGDQSAEQRFKEIQEAYDVLGDKKKRQMYDQFGFYSENASFQNAADQPGGFDFNGFDFTDFQVLKVDPFSRYPTNYILQNNPHKKIDGNGVQN